MKLLDLQDGIRSTIYSIIVLTLKNDPTLKAVIHPNGWRTYTDEPDSDAPPGEDTLPAIEVLPFGVGAQPASLITQESDFGIAINVATEGTDVRDLLNLWEAVEAALFKPGDPSLYQSINTALQQLPRKGQAASVALAAPAITPTQNQLGKQVLVAAGSIIVRLRVPR